MSKISEENQNQKRLQKQICAQVLSVQWVKYQLIKIEIKNFLEKAKSVEVHKPNQ